MSTSPRTRHPKGTPVGGQFASEGLPFGSSSLVSPTGGPPVGISAADLSIAVDGGEPWDVGEVAARDGWSQADWARWDEARRDALHGRHEDREHNIEEKVWPAEPPADASYADLARAVHDGAPWDVETIALREGWGLFGWSRFEEAMADILEDEES